MLTSNQIWDLSIEFLTGPGNDGIHHVHCIVKRTNDSVSFLVVGLCVGGCIEGPGLLKLL